ncbi:DNA replication protein [Tulasnella sp. UAMH 9824]|nr:DNA replication protein [Tulasnella sp. UAMH 9824]
MDQASHFGGAASSIGSGGETGEGGGEFREGLDATERELFTLAQESVQRTKEWYPPTIGHLRGVLELLRPTFSGLPGASILAFEPPPCALVLVDPSNYFLGSEIERTFSNYSSLLVQALATASFMDSAEKGSRPAVRFTVFDRGIGGMHLPILSLPLDDNSDPSSSPQRQGRRQTPEEDETELVYKYFDAVGIIEALVQGSSDVDRVSEIPDSKQFVMRFLQTETEASLPSPLYWNEEAGEVNTWTGFPSTRIRSQSD